MKPKLTLRDLFWLVLVIVGFPPAVGACRETNWETVVESLANRSPAPVVQRDTDRFTPAPANYDWEEQDRILKVIQTLIDNVEEAWPALAEHCDDERYCVTFNLEVSVARSENYSVGMVCNTILFESITAAHMCHTPDSKSAWIMLRWPAALPKSRRTADMKKWYQMQGEKGQPLYELQIEFCQWAIDNMPEKYDTEERIQEAIAGLKREIETLKAKKKPVSMGKFTKESRTVWRKPR